MKKNLLIIVLIGAIALVLANYGDKQNVSEPVKTPSASQVAQPAEQQASAPAAEEAPEADSASDWWRKPTDSEHEYPNLNNYKSVKIEVSIAEQRVRIYGDGTLLLNMICSTGAAQYKGTPTGDYVIESERGDHFYNASSNEGANDWVSFKDHGTYLFHSVPTDKNKNFITEEANNLGKPISHGCIRLSVADANWFYKNIKTGTPVHIA
ncbi:MAG: L,D-transpeptidase [Lactobacillales bacterium]|jgi:lipoprotein-anchoring transpeptidase ErfK/SrfK|nr:L,D-transpeptidase [Lactobacillales bacterium]